MGVRLWGRQDASLEIGLGWCLKDPMEVQMLRTQRKFNGFAELVFETETDLTVTFP